MTNSRGLVIASLASDLYCALGRDNEADCTSKLNAAMVELGLSTDVIRTLIRKLSTYQGSCWIGAAPRYFDDDELLGELKSTCLARPPSRWPSLGDELGKFDVPR